MLFRKKPVVINAVLWDGNSETIFPLAPFTNSTEPPFNNEGRLHIATLEGTMVAEKGDWIIKGIQGEIYPCKPAIFEETYEAV